ncbi:MAG: TetR/AcrR family transcriptional regulator [Propionibacteriales bacterium]|nr:TetR/AcrR family transcriptional regulator [Propionibacteriales bacterium]
MGEKRNFMGETPDERKGRRRRELIDAALSLVHEGGLPALGVRSVTSKANLSSRYFYENFDDIDDLLIAASEAVALDLLAVGFETLHAPGLEPETASEFEILDLFRAGIDAALGVLLDDPRKIALMVAASAGGQRVRQHLTRLLETNILGDADAASVGFDEARTLYAAGGLVNLVMAFVSGDIAMSRGEVVESLARLTLAIVVDGMAAQST